MCSGATSGEAVPNLAPDPVDLWYDNVLGLLCVHPPCGYVCSHGSRSDDEDRLWTVMCNYLSLGEYELGMHMFRTHKLNDTEPTPHLEIIAHNSCVGMV